MVSSDNNNQDNRVVISGISGRFPKSNNTAELLENFLYGRDCTTTDHGRWNFDTPKVPQCMGKCDNLEKFDRVFFGILEKLARVMDPVLRNLLEHSFEAVMDAGINPKSLKGSNIAVFVATNLSESEKILYHRKVQHNAFAVMGGSKAMIPNRISFFLGLHGPSVNIDSGCTGSAVALERAYALIKEGHCDGALVCGGISNIQPHLSYQMKALGLLSSDGKTRSFDDKANGHTRSDGMAVLFLQRASDAKRIYQEIINSRSLHDGCNNVDTIMYPKIEAQIKLMKNILLESNLKPDDISYIEASGVGIKNYDADELNAINSVYGNRQKPLYVGSVKSYLGNAIPANTLNSIIKITLGYEIGQIFPNLHYETPNSKALCLKEGKVRIPTDMIPWIGDYTAVNTTSSTGTSAHIILKAPNIEKKNNGIPDDDLPRLIFASGRTEESVKTFLDYIESKSVDVDLLQLMYDIFESNIEGHLYRGYTIVPAKNLPDKKIQESIFVSGEIREIWWIFSGMGSQWVGMGEALLKLPIFEAAIKKCDGVLKPHGFDIYRIITEKDPKMFDNIVNSFIGIAAIQIGLVDVLHAVGLKPDYIIGHSVGELGCAYADGCFTAEQMIMASLSRGLASLESKLEKGSMAAVGLGYNEIKPLCPPDIDIACHNGPGSTTISGPAESMTAFVANLTAKGIFARKVPSSNIAYHSRYIAPAGKNLLDRLQKVIPNPNPRSSKWLSTSIPRHEWNTLKARLCSAEYHTNNLLSPVLFDEVSNSIPANAICIEIAPHGLLQAILKKSLSETCSNIPLTLRGHPDNLEVLLSALGKLYNVGLQPKISNLYPRVKYPVGRGTASISSLVRWDHSDDLFVDFYKPVVNAKNEGGKTFVINLNDSESNHFQKNVIRGKIIVPLSFCLVKVWEMFQNFSSEPVLDVTFEDVKIYNLLLDIPDDDILKFIISIPKGSGHFEIFISNEVIASGQISSMKEQQRNIKKSDKFRFTNELQKEDFYTEMEMRGLQYSESLKNILKTSIDGTSALIKWTNDWVAFIDATFQLLAFSYDTRRLQIPLLIRKLIIDHEQHEIALRDSEGIYTALDKKLNRLYAGGIEIQDLKFSVLPRIPEQNRFSNDTMNIVQNIDKSDNSLSNSLRSILQLILENTFTEKIQKIQLISIENSLENQEIFTAMNDVPEACLFKIQNVPYSEAKFYKALTVISSSFENYDLDDISRKMMNGEFFLTLVDLDKADSYINLAESKNLRIVFMRKSSSKYLILSRKKNVLSKIHIINASKNVDDTIEKIITSKISSIDERIFVLFHLNNRNDISQLVEKLEGTLCIKNVRLYVIEDPNISSVSFSDERFRSQAELDLFINILTLQNTWATIRSVNVTQNLQPLTRWSANQKHSYDPLSITWTDGSILQNSKNSVEVEYSTLNSQDILIASGVFYSDLDEIIGSNRLQETHLGLEFSGVDCKGNRVMGVTCGNSMSNSVIPDDGWLWDVPKTWSLEDAATVPLSYLIAYKTLIVKADIKARERILIDSTCDGHGLALLHLANHKKCEIFATYTTIAEKKLIQTEIPGILDSHLFQSTGMNFRDEILHYTEGKGIDVIIFNRYEIERLQLDLSMGRRNARVIMISDLSDNRIHDSIGMEIFLKEMNFYSVVTKGILSSDMETKRTLINLMRDGIKSGSVKPLIRSVYNRESLQEAFHACREKKYHGKIVVKVQPKRKIKDKASTLPRFHFSHEKSFLILESSTNFALELIDWLIVRGARKFVLASSINHTNNYMNFRMNLWKSYGVQINLHEGINLSLESNVLMLFQKTLTIGSIEGIFDLTRIGIMKSSNSDLDLMTLTIDKQSRMKCPDMKLFIICSSIINRGSLNIFKKLGHINYPDNKELKNVLENRKKDNLPGLMIRWGIESNTNSNDNLPCITKYIENLDEILGTRENIVDVSFLTANTTEIETYGHDDSDCMTADERDRKLFVTMLYDESDSVDGYSNLVVD